MKRAMLATLIALSSMMVYAQDFGEQAATDVPVETTAENSAIVEIQQVMEEDVAPAMTAEEAINEYFNSKDDWQKGYDEENNRIIVAESVSFDIANPEVSTDFIKRRKAKMTELMLKAKAKVIEQIMSQMSGERILGIPGNPIAKQIEKEQRAFNKQLEKSRRETIELDQKLTNVLTDSISSRRLLTSLAAWYTAAEAENLVAKFDAEKRARYEAAKAEFDAALEAYEALLEKAEEIKGSVSKEMKTSLSRLSAMPIYGCTVLQQAESITEKNGKYTYQIAILYAWSGEMQQASTEILKGCDVAFTPGKKSIKQWIAEKAKSGALAQWCGPRQYIDNKGNMWFLGISCAPICGDADEDDMAREIAELEASAEVMFALYSDASSSKTLNTLTQTVRTEDGGREDKIYEDFSKLQSESFKELHIAGNTELYSGVLHHPSSGLDVRVVVYGVNTGNQRTLRDLQTHTTSLGIDVNLAQGMEAGRQRQLRQAFETSKKQPLAQALGEIKAEDDLSSAAAKAKARRAQRKKNNTAPPVKAPAKGTLKPGAVIIFDEE